MTEVGPVVAKSVLEFFESEPGRKILRRMKQLRHFSQRAKNFGKESGKAAAGRQSLCSLTGALPSMTREEATAENRSARRPCQRQR